jgi:recombination protein RecA
VKATDETAPGHRDPAVDAPKSRKGEHAFDTLGAVHRLWRRLPTAVTARRYRATQKDSEGDATVSAQTNGMDREKALDIALGQIEKQFGQGAVMRMDADSITEVAAISTGALTLDAALGVGGLPRGRVTEVYGPESSGKTTVALHAIAEAQRDSGIAAFIDAEHALDPTYARALGVDVESLLVSQPDTGEQALEIADMLIRSGAVDMVVIDSVAALTPQAEIEGEMGDSHVGLQARLMSQALRKLSGTLSRSRTSAVFINQIREKVGVTFGSPETQPGGRALKFYSSVRLDVRRIESLKDGNDFVGNRVRVKVVKNKVAPPFRQAEFDILFGEGISKEGALLDIGVNEGLVKKAGAWFTYDGEQLGQGRENARKFLKEHDDVAAEITKKVTEHLGLVPTEAATGDASETTVTSGSAQSRAEGAAAS